MKKISIFSLLLFVLSASSAFADIFTGSVTNLGITDPVAYANATIQGVGNAWGAASDPTRERGLTLSWTIQSVGSNWEYTYTLDGGAKATDKAITNFDLGSPLGFSPSNLMAGWTVTSPGGLLNVTTNATSQLITETSNATIPATSKSIDGIQWHFNTAYTTKDVASNLFVLTFISDLAPVWGDFLVYSDQLTNSPMAWSSKLGIANTSLADNGNAGGWILVPGAAAPVPIPPAVFMFGSGLSGLFFMRRRKVTA